MMSELVTGYYRSLIGVLEITGSVNGVSSVSFVDDDARSRRAAPAVVQGWLLNFESNTPQDELFALRLEPNAIYR